MSIKFTRMFIRTGAFMLVLFFCCIAQPLRAEEPLYLFTKDSKPPVEPNVLLLIDTSGSMAFDMQGLDTGGDGTQPDGFDFYYGKDRNPGKTLTGTNNLVTLVDANGLPSSADVRFKVNFNYHPNLVYIPRAQIVAMDKSTDDYNTAKDRIHNLNHFAEYNAEGGDISPDKFAELTGELSPLSIFKYPNDSRMYILKNVMYRLLHDKSIYSGLRIALAAYNQVFEKEKIAADWYNRTVWDSDENVGHWEGGVWVPYYCVGKGRKKCYEAHWEGREWVLDWFWASSKSNLHWKQASSAGARMHEWFQSTTNERSDSEHLANLRKWFSGSLDIETNLSGERTISKEFRAQGNTPLQYSIFNSEKKPDAPSALQFFLGKEALGKDAPHKYLPVIKNYCQQNWLIVLTDGADTWDVYNRKTHPEPDGHFTIEAVRSLADANLGSSTVPGTEQSKPNQKIRAFVIGFVDKNIEVDLAAILDKAAKAGRPDLPKPENSRPGAFMADSMESLFNALRKIFAEIQSAKDITGGSPMITPPRGPGEETALYVPRHDVVFERQWKGSLRKDVRKVKDDGTVYYEKAWDASITLNGMQPASRKIFTTSDLGTTLDFVTANASVLKNSLELSEDQTQKFISWLRGEDIYDEEKNSEWIHKLFDINHSGLIKIGPPAGGILGELYASFSENHRNRKPIVYVQSNAGMLHAFDDKNENKGKELFAFIPPNVLSGGRLRGLRWDKGSYSTSEISYPRYLLNGPLIAEDVLVGGEYRTLLLGLSGPGGLGMYVLDVTDAGADENPKFVWALENAIYDTTKTPQSLWTNENAKKLFFWSTTGKTTSSHNTITSIAPYDYRLLRRTISKPFIGRVFMENEEKWVFLMGNGIPSGMSDDQPEGVLYISQMTDAQIIRKFPATAPVTSIIVPVFRQQDAYGRISDFVAGDSSGTVYKGDLSSLTDTGWKWNAILEFPQKNTTSGIKKNGGIFRGLNAAMLNEELWLFAGTGEVLDYLPKQEEDVTNYFAAANISGLDAPLKVVNSDLQLLSAETGAADGDFENNLDRKGWYLKFAEDEIMSTSPLLYKNEFLFFFTFIPDVSDPCAENGSSRFYILNRRSGKAPAGWDKKYKEFKGLKVTGIAMAGDELVIAVTVLNPVAGAEEDLTLREKILGDPINVSEYNNPLGEPRIIPSYWKAR